MTNRDKVYLLLADRLRDGRILCVEAPIVHPAAPQPGKLVRAQVYGGYTLEDTPPSAPDAEDGVIWTLFAEADIGGFIPARLVDRHVEKLAAWSAQVSSSTS